METQTERILGEIFSFIDTLKENIFKSKSEFEQEVYKNMIEELNDCLERFEVGKLQITNNK